MNYATLASTLVTNLSLETQPVALAFVTKVPSGISGVTTEAPAACSFWRRAESEVFFAPADAHFNCPIGAMTMGFEMPDSVQQELMGFVEKMCGCDYLSPDEAGQIPTVKTKSIGTIYGPLKQFSHDPDLVLMWLTPAQAMLYSEAGGKMEWSSSMGESLFGRPACAALPVALNGGVNTISLGCMGMRTFTEVSANQMLAVIPGNKLETFVESLEKSEQANQTMKSFYDERKALFV